MNPASIRSLVDEALGQQLEEWRNDEALNPALSRLIQVAADPLVAADAERLLEDPSPDCRILAARILRETSGVTERATAADRIAARLAVEQDDDVLWWLVSATGWLGHRPSIRRLIVLASHQDAAIRYGVAGALGAVAWPDPPAEVTQRLVRMTDDDDREVRFSAVYELAEWWLSGYRDQGVRGALQHAPLRDPDKRIASVLEEVDLNE